MPNDDKKLNAGDLAKSQLALHTLRDYIFQQKPKTMLATDIVEDIPFLRPHGTNFANLIPSAAIISSDPAERKKQISNALKSMHDTKRPNHPLAQEMLGSAAKFGLGSIPASLLLGTAQLALGGKLKGYRSNPAIKNMVHQHLEDAVKGGITQGIGFGLLPPLISRNANFEKKHLDVAQKILQEHPNISSLPTGDIVSISNINRKKEKNEIPTHLKHTLESAGIGTGTAALGQSFKSVSSGLERLANPALKRIARNVNIEGLAKNPNLYNKIKAVKDHIANSVPPSKEEVLHHISLKGLKKPLLIGALGGAAIGGLTSWLTHPNRHSKVPHA